MKKHVLSLLLAGVFLVSSGSVSAYLSTQEKADLAELKYFAQKAAHSGLTADERTFLDMGGGSARRYLGNFILHQVMNEILLNKAGNINAALISPDYIALYESLTPKVPAEFAGGAGALALPAPASSSSYSLVPSRR